MNKAELIEKYDNSPQINVEHWKQFAPHEMSAKFLDVVAYFEELLTDLKDLEEPDLAEKYQQGFDAGMEHREGIGIKLMGEPEKITVEYLDELYEKTDEDIKATSQYYMSGFKAGLDYAPEKKRPEEDKCDHTNQYETTDGTYLCPDCGNEHDPTN